MGSNEELVDALERRGVITHSSTREAFLAVDRALFVPEDLQADAYANTPLPIGAGQTISQPLTVAIMLEELVVGKGMRVLDVGCGSGYSTALLSYLVGEEGCVVGVERLSRLVVFAKQNLLRAGVDARVLQAGKELGIPGKVFDRILVSAEASRVPQALIEQLVEGGLLVLPVGDSLVTARRVGDSYEVVRRLRGFRFVPLIEE